MGIGKEDVKANVVPCPGLTAAAKALREGVELRDGDRELEMIDGETLDEVNGAAGMVIIGMRKDEGIEATDAEGLKIGGDKPECGTGIRRESWAGIDEEGVVLGADQGSITLADIKDDDMRLTMRDFRRAPA